MQNKKQKVELAIFIFIRFNWSFAQSNAPGIQFTNKIAGQIFKKIYVRFAFNVYKVDVSIG